MAKPSAHTGRLLVSSYCGLSLLPAHFRQEWASVERNLLVLLDSVVESARGTERPPTRWLGLSALGNILYRSSHYFNVAIDTINANNSHAAANMGRHKQFDEGEVLDTAADLFWAKGYGATSTRDLTRETGLAATSIYHTFGDKRAMYLRVLNRYLDKTLRERLTRLSKHSPRKAIACFLKEMAQASLSDELHRGCMLVNTAIEATGEDVELQHIVAEETRLIEAFFLKHVRDGQAQGEIESSKDPQDLSRTLLAVLMGMRVLARIRPEKTLLEGLVRPALSMLDPVTTR